MVLFKRLWQRVFVYSIMLVLGACATGAFLVHKNLTDEASSVVLAFTAELGKALKNQNPAEAEKTLLRFNNQEAKFWVENEEGLLIAGERFAGRHGKDWEQYLSTARHAGNVKLWETNLQRPQFFAVVPCELRDGNALLFATYMPFPVPPLATLLSPGIISLSLITGVLALWIALRVGKPLRRLQEEVAQVSGSPAHLKHVTVAGFDEVADVSRAINRLVDSLKTHVDSMNQLVLNVSHELRSPLTRMGFSTEMAGEAVALCERYADHMTEEDKAVLALAKNNLAFLRQEQEYMNRLIGDTLFAGKLAVHDSHTLTAPVSLSAVCSSMAESFTPVFLNADTRFVWAIEPDIVVPGDETLLTQVLSNLLDNAVKYASGDAPRAWLSLSREDGHARLSVENSHPPLPADVAGHLFEPYFRHEQRVGSGVGLGLSIVRNIVQLHGGVIEMENTRRGIAFRTALPLLPDTPGREHSRLPA